MPKGHYARKSRAEAMRDLQMKSGLSHEEILARDVGVPLVRSPGEDADIVRVAELLVAPAMPSAPVEPDTFETWAAADEPLLPADDHVMQKVSAWAGSVCRIPHTVSWMPADDSASLEVLLITEHGASQLKAPVGQWTEADIDAALAQMRADLRV